MSDQQHYDVQYYQEICQFLVQNTPFMFKIEQLLLELLSREEVYSDVSSPTSPQPSAVDSPELVLYPRTSFQRKLIHLLCAYYKLDHVSVRWKEIPLYESCYCCVRDYVLIKKMHISRIPNVTIPVSKLNNNNQPTLSEIYRKLRSKAKWPIAEKLELEFKRAIGYSFIEVKPHLVSNCCNTPRKGYNHMIMNDRYTHIQELPTDCILSILEYMTARDLINVGQISREWYIMSSMDYLWKPKVMTLGAEYEKQKQGVLKTDSLDDYPRWKMKYFHLNSLFYQSKGLCGCSLGKICKHDHPDRGIQVLLQELMIEN